MNHPPANQFDPDPNTGVIAWFARNSVAANLLMIFIMVAGFATANFTLRKQMFPQIEFNTIIINAAYPGAAPKDVEENIAIRVEEALTDIQGLERVVTFSRRNSFSARIRVDEDYEVQDVLDEIKVQIDGIPSFPDDMERPIITAAKYRQEVIYMSLHGEMSNQAIKDLGEEIYQDLQELPLINVSEYFSGLNYEIGIEVPKEKLREYGLSLQDVANAVRRHSVNMSAGQIKAKDGYISVRAENQAYRGDEFSSIPVITENDGSQVLLSDIAVINDGFTDGIQYSKFNGNNARTFFIGASANQDITEIAAAVHEFVETKNLELPPGVELTPWIDLTYYLNGRLNMMLKNLVFGGILVFFMLALFLKLRLAFWVMLGLPVAFFGTLLFMPWVNVTINVASLFGFIMVLGIVVDDAIVIGESVNTEIEQKGHSVENVIKGAKRVAVPATFGVLTTIAAFLPMVFASGGDAAMSQAIGWVVIFCLLFSLVESKLILPAHLVSMKDTPAKSDNKLNRFRAKMDSGLKRFIERRYRPWLATALAFRYTVIAGFIALILVSVGLFQGQFIRMIGFPKVPHDFPRITVEMHSTSPESDTLNAALAIEDMLLTVDKQLEAQYGNGMIAYYNVDLRSRTTANLTVKLVDPEIRPIDTFELASIWRENLPPLPGMKNLSIQDSIAGGDSEDGDVAFRLVGRDYETLESAVEDMKYRMQSYAGVGEVNDSRDSTTKEVQFTLKPLALSMGYSVADIASQMNASLYGLEAQRILRNAEEIKVMVRYPEIQRDSLGHVGRILIRHPSGAETPLSELAEIHIVDGVNQIRREDSKRTIGIWANVEKEVITPLELKTELEKDLFPQIESQYAGVKVEVAGNLKREIERNSDQTRDLILTLMAIYILLAIPLKSYAKPLIIMSVIPFGVIGAMIGHLIFGLNMSSLSIFGVIAAAGVVINDSLVMVDYITKASQQRHLSIVDAVVEAGSRRFRAIILTSLTTFFGLIPIIFEPSLQAKIVIPMAISLAFGVLFATFVTLLLIPCLYVVGKDIKDGIRALYGQLISSAKTS